MKSESQTNILENTSLLNKLKNTVNDLFNKGAFHILVGNLVTKFVTFFGSIFVSRILTKVNMGLLTYMENWIGYAIIFSGFGMANVMLRYGVLSKSREEHYGIFLFVIKRSIIIDVFLIIIFITVISIFPHKDAYEIAVNLLPIFILYVPFQDLINDVQMNERASFNNRRFAIISITSATLVVIARVVGAWIDALTGVIVGIVITQLFIAILLLYSTKSHYFSNIKALMPDEKTKKSATSYGFQYMITNGLWSLFMLMDIFLLANLLGSPSVVADYKIASAFPVNMARFSGAIGVFVTPYFVQNEENDKWIVTNYIKTLFGTVAILLPVSIGLIILTKPLIWIFGTQYYNTIPLMRVITLAYFIENVFRFPIANILAAIGMVRVNMIISICGFVIKLILNIIFIPLYGVYALPINSIIVQILMGIALFVVFNKRYRVLKYLFKSLNNRA